MRGRFITVEGSEGVGKSTFMKHLLGLLKREYPGRNIFASREPGGSRGAEKIRNIFQDDMLDETWLSFSELCLVSAARAQHVHYCLLPKIKAGDIVLCDRYIHSTRVYQGVMGGVDPLLMEALIQGATKGLTPDLTVFLHCDPELALERLKSRGSAFRYDRKGIDFHRALSEAFVLESQRVPECSLLLDSSKPIETILEQALSKIRCLGMD
jgi:dTMP kinase